MAFTQTWDETFPSDTQLAAMGADDIRRLTYAVRERLAVDHYNLAIEAGDAKIGFHNKTTFVDQAADLLGAAGSVRLYGKTIAGKVELFLVMADNTVIQLTTGGKIWIESLKVAAEVNKDMIRFDGTKWTRISWADFITALVSDADFLVWAATFKNAGDVVQVVNYQTGDVATGVTPLPEDDTIPQNTEGDEYLSVTITPKSATNKLKIDIVANGNHTSARLMAALFQDALPGALTIAQSLTVGSGAPINVTTSYFMTSGTTLPTTFKVRCGGAGAGTFTLNGHTSGRIWGGSLISSITVTEIKV